MRPRVSILLATYKSNAFISRQLDCLQNQSIWPAAELIIVANDPSEGERAAIESFASAWPGQAQVLVVPRETLYASWNRGISAAAGDLVAIANADDLRTQDGLELQVGCLDRNPETLFCFGPYTVVKQFGGTGGRPISPPDFAVVEFTRSMHLGPFMVWRRRVGPSQLYFDEQFQSGGDFDLAIRLACLGSGIRVGASLGAYFDGGRGLSTSSLLQPIERTAVELRYGIYDKVDFAYVQRATQYDIQNLFWRGEWHPVSRCVPEYQSWLSRRREQWFEAGVRSYPKRFSTRLARQSLVSVMHALRKPLRSAGTMQGGPG